MESVGDLIQSYWDRKKRLDEIYQERKALMYKYNDESAAEKLENLHESYAEEIQYLLSEMFAFAKEIGYRDQEIFQAEYGLRLRTMERYEQALQSEPDSKLRESYLERIQALQSEIEELKQSLLKSVSSSENVQ